MNERDREIAQVRDAIERHVPGGFRDDDGVWHAGPHQLVALASLDALTAELAEAQERAEKLNKFWCAASLREEAAEAELARVRDERDAALRALDCEHTRCPHDEEADRLWEYVEYEGETWNRCRECGLLELWAGGNFIKAALSASAQPASDLVYIARCPEHGLHGERTDCFVCGGPVEQVPMRPLSVQPASASAGSAAQTEGDDG